MEMSKEALLPLPVTKRASCSGYKTPLNYILLRVFALIGAFFLLHQLSLPIWNAGVLPTPTFIVASETKVSGPILPSPVAPVKTKAIIASSLKEDDTSWITQNLPDWEANVYVMNDEEANITVAKQKGREAAAYLSYIITHYHNLPDHMVFIHAQRYQWHNDDMMFDHLPNLQNIQLNHVTDVGYTSLRCSWDPGCPVGVRPDIDHEDGYFEWSHEFAKAWQHLFPHEDVPETVAHPCCAQFAVSRERVKQRPVQFYEKVRQWLWDTEVDAQKTGRILEYTWHKMFGEETISCPDTKTCYCKLYGYCDLECDDGSCKNRLWPLRYDQQELPKGWPEQGQGNGMPEDGWWLPQPDRPLRMQLVDGHWEYGQKYSHDQEGQVRRR